jgi:hypothetical protein
MRKQATEVYNGGRGRNHGESVVRAFHLQPRDGQEVDRVALWGHRVLLGPGTLAGPRDAELEDGVASGSRVGGGVSVARVVVRSTVGFGGGAAVVERRGECRGVVTVVAEGPLARGREGESGGGRGRGEAVGGGGGGEGVGPVSGDDGGDGGTGPHGDTGL